MPEGRCDLIFLGWTAFIGFNLVSDLIWSSTDHSGGDTRAVAGIGPAFAGSDLYRGDFQLLHNGSTLRTGTVRLMLASQPTSVSSVHFSSVSMSFLKKDSLSSFSSTDTLLLFNGIEFNKLGTVTAESSSLAGRPAVLGHNKPCRWGATLRLGYGSIGNIPCELEGTDAPSGSTGRRICGQVASVDCDYTLKIVEAEEVDIAYQTKKVAHYSIWVNLLTILQIKFFLNQMRHTEEGPSAAKVSIVSIGMQALMDAYDSFLHLCLGLSSQYMFNTIAVISLFKFILFSLLEARYLLTIWRQRNHEAFNQGWDAIRRELSSLYSRFYGVLIIGLLVIYNSLDHLNVIVVLFQVYWLPQIMYDVWQGSRSGLCPSFVIGISSTRTLFMLYLWGCPHSIFSGDLYPTLPSAPSGEVCSAVILLQLIQVSIIMSQKKLGSRWFVPWACMPWAYNYHRSAAIDPGTDCVICMSELDAEDGTLVTARCNHSFHQACLEQWMDVKMECPTCRSSLPPIM